jgi:hypothetical protein
MKTFFIKRVIAISFSAAIILCGLTSCEQDKVEPELNTAPGGGTLSTFKAYTLSSTDDNEIYGRIVFWKDNASNTLIQISLYNTAEGEIYPSGIFEGDAEAASEEEIKTLYTISGATGEFSPSKFFVISDKTFYDGLDEFDAYVQIFLDDDVIAVGDVGMNADPVAEDD